MAISFKGASILFTQGLKIGFSTSCCCSSSCFHCDIDQSPTANQIQISFAYVGAGTGIPEGVVTGCVGGDVCNDYDGATYILDENPSSCRWRDTTTSNLFCDDVGAVEYTIENGASFSTKHRVFIDNTSFSHDAEYITDISNDPINLFQGQCINTLPIDDLASDSSSLDYICNWADVETTITRLF